VPFRITVPPETELHSTLIQKSEFNVISRSTVSRPVYLGIRLPSGARDQFLFHFLRKYFQTFAMFFLWGALSDERSVAVSPRQYNTQIHKSHTQYTYTNTHITQNNTTKTKTNQPTKLHKQWRTYYSQWIQRRKRNTNKAILDTGLGGLLSCETSSLSHCLDNRFIVGG
jgi:hypothetical protein